MLKKLFNSFKKDDIKVPLFYTTDLHSHLIPEIDDGSKSMEQSIDMIKSLKKLGFKKLITTPHIMSHRYPNNRDIILNGLDKVQKELVKQNINMAIEAASEYYYDEHFIELIGKKELLTFGDNYVLFELSYTTPTFGIEQTVFKLLNAGYKPVLAHPERYTYFSSSLEKYYQLKEIGLEFQINVNSIDNFYGKKSKVAVNYLINNGLVSFVGSDTHRPKYVEALEKSISSKIFKKIEEKNRIKNIYL
ncbi:capsular biosynthesis protein [Poseidonibacter lekithochrous]|uniref:tyrosine-protein phosphatase n=1 Tax=Poseidonibacter TaxID=2321187 RepID=UPI001C089858|nr:MULTISPECIES: CpsB/CapC family capsule biosynthesis tyrosine phosphatase [Poseidonibacter]MBU3015739.1 capsular biosynthesis protein [Poseidonibacter lekithochrous]MDO6829039.1 capsular biosynthesis protein [Poseidonibacter sp. 1_MG-2023]